MNKRRRFKSKQRRLVGRYAQQVLACHDCGGSGRTFNHVTGEVECGNCDGGGSEYTWQYAALMEWVLFGVYRSKAAYETHPLGAECVKDWL